MTFVGRVLTFVLYLSIGAIVWSLLKTSGCGASDGCLGYIFWFWIALGTGTATLLVGTPVLILQRRRNNSITSLAIALSLMLVTIIGFAALTAISRP